MSNTFKEAWSRARTLWEANKDNYSSPSTFKWHGKTYSVLDKNDNADTVKAISRANDMYQYMTNASNLQNEWGDELKLKGSTANNATGNYIRSTVDNANLDIKPRAAEPIDALESRNMSAFVDPIQPTFTYNRSQTRDWLRARNVNPYSMSGAERKALRHYLSGDTTGENYNMDLLKQMNTNYNLGLSFNKQGGMLTSKYAQGGSMEDQVMEAFKQWVAQKIQNGEVQESDLKDQNKVKQLFQLFQEEQTKVQSARMGAKLDYINQLNGKCPYGTHLVYYKQGGTVCKRCEADIHNEDKDPIKAFKQKCGGKVSRKELGGEMMDDNNKDKKKDSQKPTLARKSPIKKPGTIKKPTTIKSSTNNSKKLPGPKDLKVLPNGRYPEYWNADQRGQWDRDHDEGV